MGLAYDTVLMDVHNGTGAGIGLTNATAATGDSFNVRSFDNPAWAKLLALVVQGSGTRQARLTSPRLHDNVTGLTWQSAESPAEFLLPPEIGQDLYSVDALVPQLDAAATSDSIATMHIYYKNLEGISADLRHWQDVKPHIINLKVMEVAVITSATIGAWSDTVITTTENQLKADYKYALLGFEESAALCSVGIKGPATGNLRICAPAATSTYPLTDYFIWMGERHGLPMIPVFKANDRANTYISACANTASQASNVYAVLAQLKQ